MDINELRKQINEIDDQLVDLFVNRMQVSAQIGEYKLQNGMNVRDPEREAEISHKLAEKCEALYSPFVQALYSEIFDLSRMLQNQLHEISAIEYGLIGNDISSSYDKWIHHSFGNQSYGLYDLSEELLPLLFKKKAFKGLNISHPYRKDVISYCDRLDPVAEEIGYVNTIVKEADGTLTGYNTAYDGFLCAADKAGIDFSGKKVMVFGNGAFASCAVKAARDRGAREVIIVTRTGKDNFRNCTQHKDTDILINGTSIGMAPKEDLSPADLDSFPNLCGLLDAVFTPVDSKLICAARERGIPCENGLSILIEKSAKASSLFGFDPDRNTCSDLYDELTSFID